MKSHAIEITAQYILTLNEKYTENTDNCFGKIEV